MEKIKSGANKHRIWQGDRHLGPVERQVLGKLIRQETVGEAKQLIGQEMEKAKGIDQGMVSLLGRLGVTRKIELEQRQVIWDLAIKAGLTPGEVYGVIRKWGLTIS